MTNFDADSANNRDMPKPRLKLTRAEMQAEALIIESLLVAAQALCGSDDPSEAMNLMDMAQARASRLNRALDSVNAPEAAS